MIRERESLQLFLIITNYPYFYSDELAHSFHLSISVAFGKYITISNHVFNHFDIILFETRPNSNSYIYTSATGTLLHSILSPLQLKW